MQSQFLINRPSRLLLGKGERFGRENFSLTKPVNGLHFRLLIRSLAKSGNWPSILERLNRVAVNNRSNHLRLLSRLIKTKPVFLKQRTMRGWRKIRIKPITRRRKRILRLIKRRFARLARVVMMLNRTQVGKIKNKISYNEAARVIRQYKLGRTVKFRLFSLKLRKFKSARSRVLHRSISWRFVHSLTQPVSLFVEIKSKKRGARLFSVPVPIKSVRRRHSIFIHWIKQAIREGAVGRGGLPNRIGSELKEIIQKRGRAVAQLKSLEKAIKQNRVFLRKSRMQLV